MTRHLPPAPAVLDATESPRWIRRGSQSEVLAGLRRLLSRPAENDAARLGVVAAAGTRRAGEVTPYESVTTTATSAAARGGCQ